ncbi:hypothetical protein [Haliangium ochraceum]|uniref:hypothetical protein n=1 Tax=Haliangium ochraceum TaxID=80816 RepID=UPI0018EF7963|nr:hypothetical protein [Haliangium ochraceum]
MKKSERNPSSVPAKRPQRLGLRALATPRRLLQMCGFQASTGRKHAFERRSLRRENELR